MEQVFWSKHCFLLILQKNKTAQECWEDVITKSTRDIDCLKAGLVLCNPSPAIHVAAYQAEGHPKWNSSLGEFQEMQPFPSETIKMPPWQGFIFFSTLIKIIYFLELAHEKSWEQVWKLYLCKVTILSMNLFPNSTGIDWGSPQRFGHIKSNLFQRRRN